MSAKVFVDTNILVYCRDAFEPEKQQQALAWMTGLWETGRGRLSFQVLQELYVTVTQKLKPGMDILSAQNDVRAFLAWQPLPADARVMAGAWFIKERVGLGWWDALIVAIAQIVKQKGEVAMTPPFCGIEFRGWLGVVPAPECQSE